MDSPCHEWRNLCWPRRKRLAQMRVDKHAPLSLEAGCGLPRYHQWRGTPRTTASHLLDIIDSDPISPILLSELKPSSSRVSSRERWLRSATAPRRRSSTIELSSKGTPFKPEPATTKRPRPRPWPSLFDPGTCSDCGFAHHNYPALYLDNSLLGQSGTVFYFYFYFWILFLAPTKKIMWRQAFYLPPWREYPGDTEVAVFFHTGGVVIVGGSDLLTFGLYERI